MPICKYRNVSERDMDLLFIEAFAVNPQFPLLFINETKNAGKEFNILSTERSKVDYGLGESDITVIYETEGLRYALLIEDKIDAIAMPDQHDRYVKRGQKGVANGEYSDFDIFILCPERYRQTNEEAKKYEHFVSYESCRNYFADGKDAHSHLWYQQISQALETVKPEYKVEINEIAVDSFQKYAAFQNAYYPRLRLQNNPESQKVNGWWPQYMVGSDSMYILHKTDKDCVDLTIAGAADRMGELALVLKWLHDAGHERIFLEKTGKSASFRIQTPPIKMSVPFEMWKIGDLEACFEAIQELTDIAAMLRVIDDVIFGREKNRKTRQTKTD